MHFLGKRVTSSGQCAQPAPLNNVKIPTLLLNTCIYTTKKKIKNLCGTLLCLPHLAVLALSQV